MNNLEFKNKKVAVLGMGMEGLALVDFLINNGCEISILDKASEEEIEKRLSSDEKLKFDKIIQNNNIVKVFGDRYLDNLRSFDIIFRSPGISYFNAKIQDAKANGVEVSSQIKLFFDLCPCKIIGVTGTKGKGTTSSLIYEIIEKNLKFKISNLPVRQAGLKSNPNDKWKMINGKYPQVYLAGNIGTPAISLVPELKCDDTVILELSSFQLMDLEKSPYIAVVTNLLIDHQDYHKDENEYRSAKENIIKFQTKDNFAVLNSGSTFNQSVIEDIESDIKYFSGEKLDSRFRGNDNKDAIINSNTIIANDSVVLDPKNRNIKICDLNEIKLFGHHNLENIAAATIVADILKIDAETIKEVVKNFKGLPHRLEFVAEINGVRFINDSFATNPAPTMAAIDSFAEDKILILGGSSKGADFTELASKITDSNVKGIVLIGDESDKIEQSLITVLYKGRIIKGLSSIEDIVNAALKEASDGDIVILSPACASFGLFKNYKDRGEKFKNYVLEIRN